MDSVFKNVVIEVSFDETLYDQLKSLRGNSTLVTAEKVHLVHVYNNKAGDKFPMGIDDRDKMIAYMDEKLNSLKCELLPESANEDSWYTKILMNSDIKLETLKFLDEVEADLVVTATRGSGGSPVVFDDSFSSYLLQHSPCDVLVVRPVHQAS